MRKALLLATLFAVALIAQEFRGTVTGTITDASNAVVPDVSVRLTNLATNVTAQTRTTSAGVYLFRLIEPGRYRLRAEKEGFQPVVVEELVVQTGGSIGQNLTLQVGAVTQAVEITSESPLLNTVNVDAGQVIDSDRLEELPMNGRSPFALARLSPGVIVAGFLNETKPFDVGGNSYISIAGTRTYTTEFSLNGVPSISSAGFFSGFLGYAPPVDATQEFRVVTNGFDAQYGHNGAGLVSVTTKSGTNSFHGSAYEFLQNDKLNATNFFVNRSGGVRPPRRYNQFGGSIGGPVLLPKLYSGRDHTFFFFSYEGIRNAAPAANFGTVPSEAMRAGDLSSVAARRITIYDPATAVREGNAFVRSPFPGNRIPTNRINPITRNMFPYVPLPNVPGADLENNYFAAVGRTDIYDNYLGRFDFNASDKHRLFFSLGMYSRVSNTGDLFRTLATGSGEDWPMWTAAFDDTYVASPTLLLNLRLGYSRYTQDYLPKSVGFNPATLGFPARYTQALVEGSFPRIDMNYFTGFGTGVRAAHYTEHDHHYFAAATVSYTRAAHAFRVGLEAREKQNNIWDRGNSSGGFLFDGQFTAGPGLNAGTGFGHDFAAFLLGLPGSGSVDIRSPAALRGRYYALFAQDDWKITPHLTANLGFRYDIESPGFERHGRTIAGWLDGASPIEERARANYAANPDAALAASAFHAPGGMLYPGQNGLGKSMWDRDWGRWQPRLGLAWNPAIWQRRLSLRAGAGMTYFSLTPPASAYWQYGFSASTPFVGSIDNGVTFVGTLSDPFPNGVQQPQGGAEGPLTFLGQGVTRILRSQFPTRSNRWQMSVQMQATRSDVIEVNYTGNTQNHLPASIPVNYVPAELMGRSPVRDQAAIDYLSLPVRNPFQGLIPASTSLGRATVARAQLLYTHPQFTTVNMGYDNSGSITYNGVYVAWERRLAKGFSALANYQIAKQIIARQKQNPQDTRLVRTPGPEDRPQQFTASASYALPLGRHRLLSGWQVNSIFFVQSGAPLSWGPMVFTGSSWDDIKNVPGGRNIDQWFNIAAFDRTPARQPNVTYQYRYFPFLIGALRAPDVKQFDFSAAKRTRLREGIDLQFRAEFFNVLNHPVFRAPNTSPTSNAFGQITQQANIPRAIQLALRLTF